MFCGGAGGVQGGVGNGGGEEQYQQHGGCVKGGSGKRYKMKGRGYGQHRSVSEKSKRGEESRPCLRVLPVVVV